MTKNDKLIKYFVGKTFNVETKVKTTPDNNGIEANITFGDVVYGYDTPILIVTSYEASIDVVGRGKRNIPFDSELENGLFTKNVLRDLFREYDEKFGMSLYTRIKMDKGDTTYYYSGGNIGATYNPLGDDGEINELMEENKDDRVSRLLKLKKYFSKIHTIPIGEGNLCNFKIDYINLDEMLYQGKPKETLRLTILILDGHIPASHEFNLPVNDWFKEHMNNAKRETLQHCAYIIEEYIKGISEHFGFPNVHVDKFKFIDENPIS
jgi:hypothetical protein